MSIQTVDEKYLYNQWPDGSKLYCGNALELLPAFPDDYFDLIVTDPPYESLRRWEGVGTTARMGMGKKGTSADDPTKFFKTISNEDLPKLIREMWRILKFDRHSYLMCDNITLPYIYTTCGLGFGKAPDICRDEGIFPEWGNVKPLIWDKINAGMGYHYRSRYEFIVMFDKGKNRRLADLGIPDVLSFPRVAGKEQIVPTQKPLELMMLLIKQSSITGESVIDPFAGAGTTLLAAKNLGRKFIGIEIEPDNCQKIVNRFNVLQEQMSLI